MDVFNFISKSTGTSNNHMYEWFQLCFRARSSTKIYFLSSYFTVYVFYLEPLLSNCCKIYDWSSSSQDGGLVGVISSRVCRDANSMQKMKKDFKLMKTNIKRHNDAWIRMTIRLVMVRMQGTLEVESQWLICLYAWASKACQWISNYNGYLSYNGE